MRVAPAPPRSVRSAIANRIATVLARLPHAHRVFAGELLMPWSRFGFSNLAFLRKTGADTRDWRYHKPF